MKNMQAVKRKRIRVDSRRFRSAGQCALCLLLGWILAGAGFRGQALPLGACFVAAMPTGMELPAAFVGTVWGYFHRCDPAQAVECSALSFLMMSGTLLFQGTELPLKRWFKPLLCAFVCAILAAVRLIGTIEVSVGLWISKCLLAGLCTDAFVKARRGKRGSRLVLGAAVVMGLTGVGGYIDLGMAAAVAFSCLSRDLLPAIMMGAAMDLTGVYSPCATVALSVAAAFCKMLRGERLQLRTFSFVVIPLSVLLFFGNLSAELVLSVCLGAIVGYLAQRLELVPKMAVQEAPSGTERLEEAAQILELLGGEIPQRSGCVSESEAEEVFDAAAEQVCRSCAFFHRCWQNKAVQTYRDLSTASLKIMERGVAYEEDFTPAFRERCCRMDSLLQTINRELEGMLYRRTYREQMNESRRVLSQEYGYVADYLRSVGNTEDSGRERRFVPKISICSASKEAGGVSGDKGACFAGPDAAYYVLLCDGMGTGEDAAELSAQTIRLLQRLLQSGLGPEGALKLLNGSMLLRGSGAFSTVDLLRLDLHTGAAVLYKWGAAPSYWRDSLQVRKIGTATPPPGVGVGEDQLPQRYSLSLKGGEVLVLISDGAYGEETETAISTYRDTSPQELAALLIAGMQAEDDMTAIVVSLRLRAS